VSIDERGETDIEPGSTPGLSPIDMPPFQVHTRTTPADRLTRDA